MTVEIPITLENDLCLGINTHLSMGPPLPPGPPIPTPSIESISPMKRFPGFELGKNKLTEGVTFNDLTIVLDGHDVGLNNCDITPVCLGNVLLPMIWLNASRKTLFSAAKVTMTRADVPVAGVHAVMNLPMLTCGDPVALPTTHRVFKSSHNCVVGFEPSDIVAGWLGALSAAVVDLVAFAIGGLPSKMPLGLREAFGSDGLKFLGGASDTGSLVKLVLGPVLDGGVSYVRGRMNGTNDWSIRWTVGGPLLGGEYSVGSSGGGPVVHRVQGSALHYQRAYSTADHRWTTQRQPLPWDSLTSPPTTPALNARREESAR
ncbi:MAG: hypothetical protein U0325_29245 [Polyangiales bacterium]